ncbi:hypothetical protein J4Q44_G00136410 [Coregonus suidteri]|uniref:Uncharacterized protein n=1 Tax=Coregonus suidteri TaxID=861788 RepID=A0AAN8R764_9TELE
MMADFFAVPVTSETEQHPQTSPPTDPRGAPSTPHLDDTLWLHVNSLVRSFLSVTLVRTILFWLALDTSMYRGPRSSNINAFMDVL